MKYWCRVCVGLFVCFQSLWVFAHEPSLDVFTIDRTQGFAQVALADSPPAPGTWVFKPFEQIKAADRDQLADYWFLLKVDSPLSQSKQLRLSIQNLPTYRVVELWQVSGQRWEHRETHDFRGSAYPQGQSHILQLSPTLNPGSNQLLVKLRMVGTGALPQFKLWEDSEFQYRVLMDHGFTAFVLGVLLVMALYNLALYVSMRERTYLYFSAYIFCMAIFFPLLDNYFAVWSGLTALSLFHGSRAYLLLIAGMFLFSFAYFYSFLQVKRGQWVQWGFFLLLCLLGAGPIFLVMYSWQYKEFMNTCQLLINVILLGLMAFHSLKRSPTRSRARWLLASFGLTVVGGFLHIMYVNGKLPSNYRFALSLSLLAEIFVLSVYMASTVRRLRESKDQAQARFMEEVSKRAELLEGEVQKRTDSLQLANQTKNKFYSIIAHELRGPIGSMLVVFQLIKSGEMKLDSRLLEHITNSTGNIKYLLEDLLSWAQRQQGRLKVTPKFLALSQPVDEAINLLTGSASNKQIKLTNQVASDLWVEADPTMISTVVRNLVNNAIKFSHPGGEVVVRSKAEDGKCTLEVVDSGIGIKQERQQDLFTIKQGGTSSNGTQGEVGNGLGLLLFKDFIESNGGSIGLSSDVGKGSTFWFSLPLVAPQKTEVSNQRLPEQIERVLVVEDTPLHLAAAESALQSLQVQYDTAVDGEEAIARAGANVYELILMDIDLPKVNGVEATMLIRKISFSSKIIAVTGYSEEEVVQKYGTSAFDGYLPKPLYRESLVPLVQQLFAKAT